MGAPQRNLVLGPESVVLKWRGGGVLSPRTGGFFEPYWGGFKGGGVFTPKWGGFTPKGGGSPTRIVPTPPPEFFLPFVGGGGVFSTTCP